MFCTTALATEVSRIINKANVRLGEPQRKDLRYCASMHKGCLKYTQLCDIWLQTVLLIDLLDAPRTCIRSGRRKQQECDLGCAAQTFGSPHLVSISLHRVFTLAFCDKRSIQTTFTTARLQKSRAAVVFVYTALILPFFKYCASRSM